MENFNGYVENERYYGGNAGAKLGIVYKGENWFLKFGKTTKGFRNMEISYTTSPLSEYIGSQIYQSIGIPVHETMLGERDGKIVVACKDFRKPGDELIEFKSIKNSYVKGREDVTSGDTYGNGVELSDVLSTIEGNRTLRGIQGAMDRFWDMFVVDAFISNNDRNNGNWGVLLHSDGTKELSPVYDNGNSFANKKSDGQLEKTMQNEEALKDSAYRIVTCTYQKNGKLLNPFSYIKELKNDACMRAVQRIIPKIDMNKIRRIIQDIPEEYCGIPVMSQTRKEYYLLILQKRYDEVLDPVYQTIQKIYEQKKEFYAKPIQPLVTPKI